MAVSNETLKVKYDCNGSVVNFPVTIAYTKEEDLKVVRYDSTAMKEVVLQNITDYAISGGDVVTVDTFPAGDTITIGRDIPLTQDIDLQDNASINPATF